MPFCNQTELHPFYQQPELIEFCQFYDIAVVGYSPLAAPHRGEYDITGGPPSVFENPVL